ncbi:MAG: DUF302 domain-containing protein [Oscillospiraceae bacterium]|jgi:uncharacterized protein YpmS
MKPKYMRGKSVAAHIVTMILSVLIILLAVLFVSVRMLLNDPNAGRSMPAPSDAAISQIVSASLSGAEVQMTSEEMGGLLNYFLESNTIAEFEMGITAVSVTANENGTVDIYSPVRYRGKVFGVMVNLLPSFDSSSEELKFDVKSVQVGRLSVPVNLAMNVIESKLPSIVSRNGNTFVCDTKSLFHVNYSGLSVRLRMTEMKVANKIFTFQFQTKLGLAG